MREYAKKSESQFRTLDSNPRASKQAPIADILQAYKNGTLGKQPVQRESVKDEELLQTKTSGQAPASVILQLYKNSIQLYAPEEEEEPLQGKFEAVQFEEIDEDELLQGKFGSVSADEHESLQREEKPNITGLPDNLKIGIENLSGYSIDDVKVHYNSAKPAQLNALAYTQGTDIHVASGQEKYLPHEAWHVVQQMQGRVQPTTQLQSVNVNDNEGLEKEADAMGGKAVQMNYGFSNKLIERTSICKKVIQNKIIIDEVELGDKNKIEGLNANQKIILSIWKKDATEHRYQNIKHLKNGIILYLKDKKIVKVDNIKVDESEIKEIENKEIKLTPSLELENKKHGYIGTAIVYTGESNAESLALRYIENTQKWDEDERKSRLATNFCFNNRIEFDTETNNERKTDVESKVNSSFDKTKGKATTYVKGCLWGYKYTGGGVGKCNTEGVIGCLEDVNYLWYDSTNNVLLTLGQAKTKFTEKRNAKGVPYGALRNANGSKTAEIRAHLKGTNKTDSVYLHSIDADSPDFTTLKEEESEGWKKVLDAYDEVLSSQKSDVVIGGYNLLLDDDQEQQKYYKGKEYNHTLRSNVVDLAIRQAIHSVEPRMTYPTEPNLLIKASSYNKIQKKAWGSGAFEGRTLIDNYIKMRNTHISKKTDKVKAPNIHYDPLTSISTGVDAGGARLKIIEGKKYDKDSILGRPHYDTTSKEGDSVEINDQYIVQAQSWAGASRVATSYRAAWAAIKDEPFNHNRKAQAIEIFYPIENMVKQLLADETISYTPPSEKDVFFTDPINVYTILESVRDRLIILKDNPNFSKLLE